MSRGDRREEIFRDDLDRKSFLQALGAACEKTGWQLHAYCLMDNHFHLVVLRVLNCDPRGRAFAQGRFVFSISTGMICIMLSS